ncbi:MAG: branched-chain amino acid ABC transporter permease [Sneathiella sp.]|jgi:branched-chain amino acid transport system permease protein|uniref:branched-chain amino acid ABC transporter permease n=1 Tax=Sneathiella sp. TaxID=1964365 RepID=UPI000C6488B0|nr:branched-chain amino acid ABC transporter permease [Sneathiella sp.]MAL78795.1 branched-chain amino acid ABC transporter permease [Sneathiella sp.]|tara:strand:+ start:221 stop:1093 length:873 start_codon:yes stop_codon:yes gene_type:complete
MDYFLDLVISGLMVGALYGIIAMGFAMIYKATGVVNFAQGEVLMLVAYIAYTLTTLIDMPFWLLIPATIMIGMIVGLIVEFLFIRPMIGEPVFATVMVTIGLAVFIRSLVVLLWDAFPHEFVTSLSEQVIEISGIRLYPSQIVAFITYLVLMAAFWSFFRYSRIGIAMRAVANKETVALLMGIRIKHVYAVAWALSSIIAGIAGVLFASIYDLDPTISAMGLNAFPAAILGGLDSVLGSGFGGLIIGVVENLTGGYLSTGLKSVSGFVVIILVLMVRPYGLFGEPEIERV